MLFALDHKKTSLFIADIGALYRWISIGRTTRLWRRLGLARPGPNHSASFDIIQVGSRCASSPDRHQVRHDRLVDFGIKELRT